MCALRRTVYGLPAAASRVAGDVAAGVSADVAGLHGVADGGGAFLLRGCGHTAAHGTALDVGRCFQAGATLLPLCGFQFSRRPVLLFNQTHAVSEGVQHRLVAGV